MLLGPSHRFAEAIELPNDPLNVRARGDDQTQRLAGGLLVAGIVISFLRSRHPTFGNIPGGARAVLEDIGLTIFIVVVGLDAGGILSASHEAGQWSLPLSGTARDRYSDVARVEVLVSPSGNGWQRATVEGDTWRLDYALSSFGGDGNPLAEDLATAAEEAIRNLKSGSY